MRESTVSSHRALRFVNVSNEGADLTSEPQTLEVMVLATVPSTQKATTPLSCFIIAQLSVIYFFITFFKTPTLAKNY